MNADTLSGHFSVDEGEDTVQGSSRQFACCSAFYSRLLPGTLYGSSIDISSEQAGSHAVITALIFFPPRAITQGKFGYSGTSLERIKNILETSTPAWGRFNNGRRREEDILWSWEVHGGRPLLLKPHERISGNGEAWGKNDLLHNFCTGLHAPPLILDVVRYCSE